MQTVIPALRMLDYTRSKVFYVDKLGFSVDWEHQFEPDLPVFMQVSRDDMSFYLTEHSGDCEPGGLIHLVVPDVDAWFNELQQKGVTIEDPPNSRLEGIRNMSLFDPDGNQLRIMTYVDSEGETV